MITIALASPPDKSSASKPNPLSSRSERPAVCWSNHGANLTGLQVIMIRRLKAEVMAQLPPKRRQVVRLPKPRPQDWPKLGAHTVP